MKQLIPLVLLAVAAGACSDDSSSPTQAQPAPSVASATAAASATPASRHASGTIGAALVDLSYAHVPFPHAIRAFIPTGSASRKCLVTLGESNEPNNVRSVFCGQRTLNGVDGLLLSIFFFKPVSPDIVVAATVYQEFAKGYDPPVLYTGP